MAALRVEVRGRPALRLSERVAASTCAYCHDPLDPARRDCGCGAAYHRDCWAELGRCATLGCLARADADDRRRGGRCPQCHLSVHQALPWERLRCGGCGSVYHLGCRVQRARCAMRGCRSGEHDHWGVPLPPPRRALLAPAQREFVRTLAVVLFRTAVTSVMAALATSVLLACTDEWVVSALLGGGVALSVGVVAFADAPSGPRVRRRGQAPARA